MVAYILLACIGAVGGLGLVAMARIAIDSARKGRAERDRLAARERLVAESRSNKQPAVAMPEPEPIVVTPATPPAPRRPARAMTPLPVMPLARGELTGVINLLDESAQFALQDPPAPPPRVPKASVAPPFASPAMAAAERTRPAPPMMPPPPVALPARSAPARHRPTAPMAPAATTAEPFERPAWADGVVPKRSRRPTPEQAVAMAAQPVVPMANASLRTATAVQAPAFPDARSATALQRPAFPDARSATALQRPAFPDARSATALDRPAFPDARSATAERPAFPDARSATALDRPAFPDARSATALERPAFIDARTALERPAAAARVAKASSPPPFRAPSAAPHVAPSQPAPALSLVRAPSRPPAAFARETVTSRPTRGVNAAPATRIPVPPAPIQHAPGQTRLPVPPLPAPPPRRTRSS